MPRLSLIAAIAFAAGLAAAPVNAADEPIDTALEACLAAPDGQTTAGMVACFGDAYAAWDKALNQAYARLRSSLDQEAFAKLRDAQRAWLVYRDAESAFLASLLTPERGTMMRIIANGMMTDLVKDRALALRSLAEGEDERN
jgi:uncharacterized protein YecT (DUF1311 family)